jgi:hypothetical protein
MLAYDYPLLGLFWTILWINLVIAWLIILFHVVADIVRNDHINGLAKGLWLTAVLLFPVFGAIVYLASQGDDMASRQRANSKRSDDGVAYVSDGAGSRSSDDQLTELTSQRTSGAITEAESSADTSSIIPG